VGTDKKQVKVRKIKRGNDNMKTLQDFSCFV